MRQIADINLDLKVTRFGRQRGHIEHMFAGRDSFQNILNRFSDIASAHA